MFNWVQFLTYVIILSATPGPNTLMSLSSGMRYGIKKSLPFQYGIGVGFSVASLLCMVFCSLLSSVIPHLELPMKIIGAGYMLYLAWKTFTASVEVEGQNAEFTFWSGFFLQFINPKLYIYCITSMEAYVLPFYKGQWAALTGFALLLAFFGFFFTVCWAAFGSGFKIVFSKYGKITNTILALLLVYCAVSLFF